MRRPSGAPTDRPRGVLLRRDSATGAPLRGSSRPRAMTPRPYAEIATALPESCEQVLQQYWRAPRALLDEAAIRARNDHFVESAPRQGDALRRRTHLSTSTPRGCDGAAFPRRLNEQAGCHSLARPARPPLGLARPARPCSPLLGRSLLLGPLAPLAPARPCSPPLARQWPCAAASVTSIRAFHASWPAFGPWFVKSRMVSVSGL